MISPDYQNIISNIYTKIFLKEVDSSISVFLCGASTDDNNSIRDIIYSNIENDSQFNVVFPEWLFSSLLNKKKYNLLELENLLADNVDVIVLPLEGIGTLAELGAFASNEKLRSKILVINDKQYEHSKSFINEGPVKLISQVKKNNIYYYENDFDIPDADKIINKMRYMHTKIPKFELDKLFNLARFINYIIAIFQPINETSIKKYLSLLNVPTPTDLINPCIEILIKKKKVRKEIEKVNNLPINIYMLSDDGHYYIYEDLLQRLNLIKEFGKMRARIINFNNRKLNTLNYQEESKKFLE
jgi:hypothetical protein